MQDLERVAAVADNLAHALRGIEHATLYTHWIDKTFHGHSHIPLAASPIHSIYTTEVIWGGDIAYNLPAEYETALGLRPELGYATFQVDRPANRVFYSLLGYIPIEVSAPYNDRHSDWTCQPRYFFTHHGCYDLRRQLLERVYLHEPPVNHHTHPHISYCTTEEEQRKRWASHLTRPT